MARIKVSELKDIIRQTVREELGDVIKRTIAEVLSERYLKEMAQRMVESNERPRGVGPSLHVLDGEDTQEEDPPRALSNTTDGIYDAQNHPMKKDDSIGNPNVREGQQRSEFMNMFFEGTTPLTQREQVNVEKAATAVSTPAGQEQVAVWQKLVEGMDRVAERSRPMPLTPEQQQRQIEERRRQLEVKAG